MEAKEPFTAVMQRHTSLVLRVSRAIVGFADADDVCQETFMAALRAWPSLPADANVEAWLVTIAHRKGIDAIRARSRRPIPLETVPERQTLGSNSSDPGGLLTEALNSLTQRQRLAVAYHHVAGLPHREVAELIGGNEASVRKSASDGIRRLREALTAPKGELP